MPKKSNLGKRRYSCESINSTDEDIADEKRNKNDYETASEADSVDLETAQEIILRESKIYLDKIIEEEKDKADFEKGAIERRLKEEYLEDQGRLRRNVASNYTGHSELTVLRCKDHKDSITCLCLTNNEKFLFSGSKDGSIVKWSLAEKKKVISLKGKRKNQDGMKCISCIAVSSDNKFLVIGEVGSNDVHVLSPENLSKIKILKGHKDIITGLVFRRNSHTLYSSSADRSVRIWDLDEMAYVESKFGHQSPITSIDSLYKERCITSGGFDKSIRVWKIKNDSQLIFNDHDANVDIVKLINEENFVSCSDDGQLSVWGCLKRKPLCSVPTAHGIDENNSSNKISSIATFLNTDLVATGSSNGVKLWEFGVNFKSIKSLFDIKITGFINSLVFTSDGKYLIAGVGQEHNLGRWWRIQEAKNSIVIIPLLQSKLNT